MRLLIMSLIVFTVMGVCVSLILGISSLLRANSQSSQRLMRVRVGLQWVAVALVLLAVTVYKNGGM